MASIYQNMIDSYTFPITQPGRAVSRAYQSIAKQPAVKLTTANTKANEFTTVATHLTTTSGGNYTVSVSIPTLGVSYTTANLLYDAADTGIETALDTAAPGSSANISVAADASGLDNGAVSFTCAGEIAAMPVFITVTDVDLTGSGNGIGAVVRATKGQPDRNCYQALFEMNIVDGAGNDCGSTPAMTLPVATADYIGRVNRARLETIAFLCDTVAIEEGNDLTKILVKGLYNLPEALFGPSTS